MDIIIQSSIHTLKKSKSLLKDLTDDQLSNHSISPYYSCIGSHLKHILDFYDCILKGLNTKSIDLIGRKRDERIHNECIYALSNVERVINALKKLEGVDFDKIYLVSDDLGLGKVSIKYTFGAILAQANSHAIHHYAIISYILDRLKIPIIDESFGYNPTTPNPKINLN